MFATQSHTRSLPVDTGGQRGGDACLSVDVEVESLACAAIVFVREEGDGTRGALFDGRGRESEGCEEESSEGGNGLHFGSNILEVWG